MSLHGDPALCSPGLPAPVDQELGHALLRALQVRLHHGDQAQTSPEGRVFWGLIVLKWQSSRMAVKSASTVKETSVQNGFVFAVVNQSR